MGIIQRKKAILMNEPYIEVASGTKFVLPGCEPSPLKRCIVSISPVQSGSGSPTTSNIRPISGWTGVNLYDSPTTTAGDGVTYSASWQGQAGTVYQGYINLLTGQLVQTAVQYTLDGNSTISDVGDSWNTDNTGFCAVVTGAKTNTNLLYCNMFKVWAANSSGTPAKGTVFLNTGAYYNLRIRTDQSFTLQGFKNYVASNNIHLICELVTPITYQLSPQSVKMLRGINNVWADVGSVEIEYWAHTHNEYGGLPVLIDNARYKDSNGSFDSYITDPDWFLTGWYDSGNSNTKSYTYIRVNADIAACFRIYNDKEATSYDWWGISKWENRTLSTAGRYIVMPIRKEQADISFMYDNTNQRYIFKGKNVT